MKKYRVFVFFRCPISPLIEEFVQTAKSYNKTVLFDIDDLMIDTKYTDTIPYVQKMSPEDKAHYDDGINRTQKLLKMCDAAITSTERLAEELRQYVPEVFINRNTASGVMVMHSKKRIVNGWSWKKKTRAIKLRSVISAEALRIMLILR